MLHMLNISALRFSSVQLLGDLLFHISGVSGKMTTETASEDDNFGTAQSNKVHAPCLIIQNFGFFLTNSSPTHSVV